MVKGSSGETINGPIRHYVSGEAMVIIFDRPEIRNPIGLEVIDALERVLESELVESAGCLVFSGRDNAFAAGADLRQVGELAAGSARDFALRGQRLMKRISDLTIPTAAAVNGFCYGGALDLALACDSRVASRDATFCHPGAGLGIITGWGGTQRLPRLVGQAVALEMFFTAAPISPERALEIGLIDSIVDGPLEHLIATSRPRI